MNKKIEGSVNIEVLNQFVQFIDSLPRPIFDFSKWHPKTHYTEHVPEPRDEERRNK